MTGTAAATTSQSSSLGADSGGKAAGGGGGRPRGIWALSRPLRCTSLLSAISILHVAVECSAGRLQAGKVAPCPCLRALGQLRFFRTLGIAICQGKQTTCFRRSCTQ